MNKLIQTLWAMRGGIYPEFNKAASTAQPIKILRIPEQLSVPLPSGVASASGITAADKVLVSVGDQVLKGQPLTALSAGVIGSVSHAPTSGRIRDIKPQPLPHPSGMSGLCVVIETDGQDRWVESMTSDEPYHSLAPETLLNKIAAAGVVGLGGAAFPSAVKLAQANQQRVNTLIINAAECEPYITCDDVLMRERAGPIVIGIEILMQLLRIKQCLIGIEDNKPEAIKALKIALADHAEISGNATISVVVVPTQYPSGDARQLTQLLTGIAVPKSQHLSAAGVLCHNVATAYAVHEAVVTNQPLLSRIVTLTGDGLAQPRNVEALIGTPIRFIIEQLGGYTSQAERLMMGGPMMGFALPTDNLPISKASNCILVTSKAQLQLAAPAGDESGDNHHVMPCIRCNQCAQVCPVNLLPQQLYWHAKAHDFEKAVDHKLGDCIECGACHYVCPSRIPLVDYFRFAKAHIQSQHQASLKSSQSRARFEFNEARKLRNKQEREAKRSQHQTQDTHKPTKQDAIKAAMERAKAKKAARQAAENKDRRDAV